MTNPLNAAITFARETNRQLQAYTQNVDTLLASWPGQGQVVSSGGGARGVANHMATSTSSSSRSRTRNRTRNRSGARGIQTNLGAGQQPTRVRQRNR